MASMWSKAPPNLARYARRSRKFIDAYDKGLDGKQAAWAAKKYRGHRVLPASLRIDLFKAGLMPSAE